VSTCQFEHKSWGMTDLFSCPVKSNNRTNAIYNFRNFATTSPVTHNLVYQVSVKITIE